MTEILIIDDSKLIAEFGRNILTEKGFEISYAPDGVIGLEKAKAENPDLILLDIVMPGLDGYEVCERLKADPDTKDIPIIMLTSKGEPADRIKGLELGAVDYVTKPFDAGELIARVTNQIRIKELYQALQEKNRQLQEMANKDGLTNLYNHRFFHEHLARDVHRAQRYFESLSCIFIDIDHFKHFNDTYGHQAGDQILKTLGALLLDSVRASDLAARYGGEEFAVILHYADLETACAVAERLRKLVASHAFRINEKEFHITISLGIAAIPHPKIANPRELVDAADQALYNAKKNGRNRVEVFNEVTLPSPN